MKYLILILTFPTFLYAQSGKSEFCKQRQNFRAAQSSISLSQNLMGFNNDGGIANGGTCWWHSRFQRNAHYLAFFQANKPMKDERYYKQRIRKIISGKSISYIPGFKNLKEFTTKYRPYIQKQLNRWQLRDGILNFAWVNGLKGETSTSASKLKSMMENLFDLVEKKKNITYTKLQLPGIVSHSWLIYKMVPKNNGYAIHYIDSNYAQRPKVYTYVFGDRNLRVYDGGLIYPEKGNEYKKVKAALGSYCAN